MSNELQINSIFKPIENRLIELIDPTAIVKECNFAMQHFAKNEYLNGSTVESKQQAVLNVAQCGLTLNPILKLAYLVPRYNNTKKVVECFFEPSYQGLAKLVTDTGSAKSISCYPVFKGDEFNVSLGTNVEIKHTPKYESTEITHAYSVAILSDGSKMIEVMTGSQINDIRDGSESYKSFKAGKTKTCIWEKDYSEMCRKTVIKRIVKYLPKTEMWDKLATAIDIDNSDYGITDNQRDYIESLLITAGIDIEVIVSFINKVNNL